MSSKPTISTATHTIIDKKTSVKSEQDQVLEDNEFIDFVVESYVDKTQQAIVRTLLKSHLDHYTRGYSELFTSILPKSFIIGTVAQLIKQLLVLDAVVGFQPISTKTRDIFNMQYSHREDGGLTLEVLRHKIETVETQLSPSLSTEFQEDLSNYYSLDMEAEGANILSEAITHDMINVVIADLIALAGRNDTVPSTPDLIQIRINQAAADIAAHTRRGMGNVIVTSPTGLALLQQSKGREFVPVPGLDDIHVTTSALVHVGNLVHKTIATTVLLDIDSDNTCAYGEVCDDVSSIKTSDSKPVYVKVTFVDGKWVPEYIEIVLYRVYVTNTKSFVDTEAKNNVVSYLIGYKGTSSIDAGYVFAPLLLLKTACETMDMGVFEPNIRFTAELGHWQTTTEEDTTPMLSKSSNYYRLVSIDANSINHEEIGA